MSDLRTGFSTAAGNLQSKIRNRLGPPTLPHLPVIY